MLLLTLFDANEEFYQVIIPICFKKRKLCRGRGGRGAAGRGGASRGGMRGGRGGK